jgi:hypothetical protein
MNRPAHMLEASEYTGMYPEDLFSTDWWKENV